MCCLCLCYICLPAIIAASCCLSLGTQMTIPGQFPSSAYLYCRPLSSQCGRDGPRLTTLQTQTLHVSSCLISQGSSSVHSHWFLIITSLHLHEAQIQTQTVKQKDILECFLSRRLLTKHSVFIYLEMPLFFKRESRDRILRQVYSIFYMCVCTCVCRYHGGHKRAEESGELQLRVL